MKPPIIINEHGDVSFFESAEDAKLYLEPIDILNEEYVAYDSEGRLLQLSAKDHASFDSIDISSLELEPKHQTELRQIIVKFFLQVGIDQEWLSDATLEKLVAEGIRNYKTG